MQQYRYLSKKDKTINPRLKVIADLTEEVATELKLKSQVLVMGDFNEDIGDADQDGIKSLLLKTGLVSVFQTLKNKTPSTRANNRAIDHIFISPELLPFVTQAGLVPEEICFASDHVAMFLDLNPRILETNNTPIPPAPYRKLKTHNIPNVKKYIEAVVYQMQCHSVVKRLEKLETYIKDFGFDCVSSNDLEKIDKLMTQIMLRAEDDLAPNETKYAFSVELLHQMRKVRLIKTTETMEEEALQLLQLFAPELEKELEKSRQNLIEMQNTSWEIRNSHYDTRIQAAAEDDKKEIETKIKEMKERERQGGNFAHIGSVLKTKKMEVSRDLDSRKKSKMKQRMSYGNLFLPRPKQR